MEPNVFHNVDTGLRISIVASGKLHRATSGGWWLVTNHHDSGLHRHPTIARGFAETVHWDLRDPDRGKTLEQYHPKAFEVHAISLGASQRLACPCAPCRRLADE